MGAVAEWKDKPVAPAQPVSPWSTARAAARVRFDAPSFEMQALT
jgi:hypothetical protein